MQASEGVQAETLKVVVVVATVCGVPIGVTMALPRPYTGVQKGCTEMLLKVEKVARGCARGGGDCECGVFPGRMRYRERGRE